MNNEQKLQAKPTHATDVAKIIKKDQYVAKARQSYKITLDPKQETPVTNKGEIKHVHQYTDAALLGHEDTKITLDLDISDDDSWDDEVQIIVRDDNQKPMI
ncbi:hypothetical protein A2U01_0058671, partial [Trifolium medium]|nr:hypothetical protein [Trifolium medium]